MKCFAVQDAPAEPPRAPMPAVAPNAAPHRYAMTSQPAYRGEQVSSPMPGTGKEAPQPRTVAAHPAHSPHLQQQAAAPKAPDGCGVCGSADVRFVLEADVGIDAAALDGRSAIVRSPFCSLACLAERLGLQLPRPPEMIDGAAAALA